MRNICSVTISQFHHMVLVVVGCVDIKSTSRMRVKRRGDEATIQCSGSDAVWKLKCDGNKWIGSMGNCSDGKRTSRYKSQKIKVFCFEIPLLAS